MNRSFIESAFFIRYTLIMTSDIRYPDGRSFSRPKPEPGKHEHTIDNHSRRGARLEEDLNASNTYYNENDIALIHKKPTPIQVVRVDYPARNRARIVEAYYRTPSTTDYNGIYKGRYIDFEAKETRNQTSFPKYLIHPHQISHLKKVKLHGGIGFFIIRFSHFNETWLIDASDLIGVYETTEAASIPHRWFSENGILLKEGFLPRIQYLKAVDEKYLKGDS